MKNSNGSARRNFFRSSSRRIRVVPGGAGGGGGGGTAPTPVAGSQQQHSLIAAGQRSQKAGKAAGQAKQQQLSPMEPGDQATMVGLGQPTATGRQHNSPSDFGGSSSGGFTYFSGEYQAAAVSKEPGACELA